jgi:outer membrane receptor protein involved in Fe transport
MSPVRSRLPVRSTRIVRLLLVALAISSQIAGHLAAQVPSQLHLEGQVADSSGHPAASATILAEGPGGRFSTLSDSTGHFKLDYPAGAASLTLHAVTGTMESDPLQVSTQSPPIPVVLILHPSAVTQQVTVTATRSSIDLPATANTVYALTAQDLDNYPATELDDKLRQQPGFELYRRSSSSVQNPTSQGISLRGLGSTAASRTLVLEDSVPLNDPFGGWIHWDEIPAEAISAVTIATGGGSDLYGSSALGGVIDVVPARPTTALAEINLLGGGQDTTSLGLRGDLGNAQYRQLLAADSFRTGGYIPTAPSLAGPVDVDANVHDQAARSETDRIFSDSNRAFLVGNLLNEARGNGTPLQNNATRLWRYIAGDDWTANSATAGRVRLFGSDEGYRQSFSSINAARTAETLTRLQRVRTQELGASTDATLALSPVAIVLGADARDIRATDNETPISAGLPSGVADTTARQRFLGGFAEALASGRSGLLRNTSAAFSLRFDSASNLSTRVLSQTFPQPATTSPIPNRNEFIVSPRLGVVRQLTSTASLHASVFRAFRTPTMNELYRTGQVGEETTQANSQLQSERATGWEIGATYTTRANLIALAGTYFWTQINRPVSAVLISSTATSILEKRENLGQIVSQGTELHLDLAPTHAISATLGYQYAHAIVTQFSAQPSLVGNWIPEVPRQSFTAQLRAARPRLGQLTLAARASGHAWDDSANTYLLHAFFQLNLAAHHDFGRHVTASAILTNLLNQRPDVARTPILTLGSPILAQGGLSFHWFGAGQK